MIKSYTSISYSLFSCHFSPNDIKAYITFLFYTYTGEKSTGKRKALDVSETSHQNEGCKRQNNKMNSKSTFL